MKLSRIPIPRPLIALSQPLSQLKFRAPTTKAKSGKSTLSLLTSFGKVQMYLRVRCTIRAKRVPFSRCLAGLTLTLRRSALLLVRWVGWELKCSLLKNLYFLMSGLKMENLTPGGSITSLFLTSYLDVMEPEKNFVI
jgi:hypothetical protein